MNSVRLKLLVLALAPLGVLLPLLMLLAMARWTTDYDELLISKVDSDLRIAEQYLGRILAGTGAGVEAIADSRAFETVLAQGDDKRAAFLEEMRTDQALDFLYYLPEGDAEDARRWPVIQAALQGQRSSQIDIFSADDLASFPPLENRARIDLIETKAAVPTERTVEDRGMVVHTAAPVKLPDHRGVLVGGILLNRNLDFIDTINALVYLNAATNGDRQGTATLFLEDVRVSTNVRLFEDVRALGTRVSAEVRAAVLTEGATWLDRAFVVNDWYISGYLPLIDSYGERVGMLYVGFLEAPFASAKRAAYFAMLASMAAVLILTAPLFLRMARGIFSPLEKMTRTMKQVERGDLAARIGDVGRKDEIGQVATHLDTLLDQVQERDRALRSWAEELNDRVDRRTAELRTAKEKLEETFQQLVTSEKLASIGEITAGVAHEINNPVAVIQGNVDVIRQTLGAEAEDLKTELDLIDRQVQRIDGIVGKLLQFARPTDYSATGEGVELSQLVEDCRGLIAHVQPQEDVRVTTDFAEVPNVAISAGEMQQVVVNLMVNAVQAMNGVGEMALSIRPARHGTQDGVELTVADSGPGIDADNLNRVFDPFHTTKLGEGTGLGLSISQTLIRQAGGTISVSNRPEGGAVFTVWLPAAAREAAQ
ncbi:HAMP domain-containing sensor histidine kinase [Aliiroseovarius sp. PrR006]|uniref:sensor histidine kinase n=1 Tax=Aliiroseovarius sp. PrR006 TaxID=2706883 RepID=UPI0013D4401A|nr:HAMP domain-containing sensor histidine kinase [Aliiroseovarius sp. PrR006]NDW53857.1 HAMP domain-containing protein [Aliiroseovarius sp. PrR006]